MKQVVVLPHLSAVPSYCLFEVLHVFQFPTTSQKMPVGGCSLV